MKRERNGNEWWCDAIYCLSCHHHRQTQTAAQWIRSLAKRIYFDGISIWLKMIAIQAHVDHLVQWQKNVPSARAREGYSTTPHHVHRTHTHTAIHRIWQHLERESIVVSWASNITCTLHTTPTPYLRCEIYLNATLASHKQKYTMFLPLEWDTLDCASQPLIASE